MKGRGGKRVRDADDQRQDNDHPDFDPFRGDKPDDNHRTEHLNTLKKVDDPGPVFSIGQDVAEKDQYPERCIHCEGIETEEERRTANAQQQPGFGHRLHPGPDMERRLVNQKAPYRLVRRSRAEWELSVIGFPDYLQPFCVSLYLSPSQPRFGAWREIESTG